MAYAKVWLRKKWKANDWKRAKRKQLQPSAHSLHLPFNTAAKPSTGLELWSQRVLVSVLGQAKMQGAGINKACALSSFGSNLSI